MELNKRKGRKRGGGKRRKTRKKRGGGKRRKTRKQRGGGKRRKTRKQRGGGWVTKYEWVVPALLENVDYDEILRKQIDVFEAAQREGAEVHITAFDGRHVRGHVTSLEEERATFDPNKIAAMRVHIDGGRFRHSASVPVDGTWEGVPRPFEKIEVLEEQKKRPKSARKGIRGGGKRRHRCRK